MGAVPLIARAGEPDQEATADVAVLLGRIKSRDPAALRALYLAYARRVQSYAYQVLRDEHAAQDVAHDVFIRVWRYAASYDATKSVKPEAWLFQIARNVALDEAVQRARMTRADEPDTLAPQQDEADDDSGWERLSDQTDSQGEAFRQALQALPSHCRQVLHLRFHQGMSNPEIASHLRIPVGTAKTWLRRGLLQMRERLKVVAAEAQKEEWV